MKALIFIVALFCMGFTVNTPKPISIPVVSKCDSYNLDFELVNKTGYDISEIFVSPTSMRDWGEDIMGKDVLLNGESVDISFDTEETEKKWDIYVTWVGYGSDEDVYWTGFDLSKISRITLYYNSKTGKTWAETD